MINRRLYLFLAAAVTVVLASSAAAASSPAAAEPGSGGPGTPVRAGAPAVLGTGGWKVLTSATATQTGQEISAPGFDTHGWLSVRNDDGGAPGTEIEALLQNGGCPNVFFSDNMRQCFGYTDNVGPVTVPQFAVPWWYRTDFRADLRSGQTASLIVNGVVGAADVWVNGTMVADQTTVTGAYTKFAFDVTGLLRSGTNTLAVKMYPNDPNKMLTLDDVDWNQIPPDNNTGIQFPVQLAVDGTLSVGNAHVLQANAADFSRSRLTVRTDVTNNTGSPQTGAVTAAITSPGGRQGFGAGRIVTVPAHTTKTVVFAGLTISHPQVWWPYQLGGQPLYRLVTSVSQHRKLLNSTSETFGIRTVTSYLTGSSPAEP